MPSHCPLITSINTLFTQLEEFVCKEFAHKKTDIANQEKNKPHNRDPNLSECESCVICGLSSLNVEDGHLYPNHIPSSLWRQLCSTPSLLFSTGKESPEQFTDKRSNQLLQCQQGKATWTELIYFPGNSGRLMAIFRNTQFHIKLTFTGTPAQFFWPLLAPGDPEYYILYICYDVFLPILST